MTHKGRTLKRESASAPWKEAAHIAGSEETLKAGRPYSTWKGWKDRDEVPGYALAPFLLAWWRGKWALVVEQRVAEERAHYGALRDRVRELAWEIEKAAG